MGRLTQRKRFEAEALAIAATNGFADSGSDIPGVGIVVTYTFEDDAWWVYVTQEGHLVTGREPLLPEYEFVNFIAT